MSNNARLSPLSLWAKASLVLRNVPGFAKGRYYWFSVWPCCDQQTSHHSTSQRNTTIARSIGCRHDLIRSASIRKDENLHSYQLPNEIRTTKLRSYDTKTEASYVMIPLKYDARLVILKWWALLSIAKCSECRKSERTAHTAQSLLYPLKRQCKMEDNLYLAYQKLEEGVCE